MGLVLVGLQYVAVAWRFSCSLSSGCDVKRGNVTILVFN